MHSPLLIALACVVASCAHRAAPTAPAAPPALASPPVRVEYRPPTNPAHEAIYAQMRSRRVLERFQEVLSVLRLPRTLTLSLGGCDGSANAWYEPANGTVTFCYEYLEDMRRVASSRDRGPLSLEEASEAPAMFIMLHEAGHAVFDLLEVPILGREEDAADTFAAVVLLRLGRELALRTLRGAAWSFLDASSRTPDQGDFADMHGLDAQRYYNILCLAYGSDPAFFAAAVTERKLPTDRAADCAAEYNQALFAMQKLIVPAFDAKEIHRLRTVHGKQWGPGP